MKSSTDRAALATAMRHYEERGFIVRKGESGFLVGTIMRECGNNLLIPAIDFIGNTVEFKRVDGRWRAIFAVTGGYCMEGDLPSVVSAVDSVYSRVKSSEMECLTEALAEVDAEYRDKSNSLQALRAAAKSNHEPPDG